MKRRDAIKNLSLSLGYVVSAPTIMNILSSCTAEGTTWTPLYFTNQEKQMIIHLADIIVPTTDIAGAIDVNAAQFMDRMYANIIGKEKKKNFRKGAEIFGNEFLKSFNKNPEKGTKEEFEQLFSSYFDLSEEQSKKVLDRQQQNPKNIPTSQIEEYRIYEFLIEVRQNTLFAYFTSEKVGEEILNYDPVPGSFEPCIPLSEVGNSWSL